MKIRSLLLGSVAAAGLSTGAFAADLGVLTSLDVCDALGLSGLTISSDTNCLQITGGVNYEFKWGDYNPAVELGMTEDGLMDVSAPGYGATTDDNLEWDSRLESWIKFVATADSDFGPAKAVLKLKDVKDIAWVNETTSTAGSTTTGVEMDEAYVSIGDSTVIMAGKKSSIMNFGDDVPLNFLGLFNSSEVDTGVKWDDSVVDEFLDDGGVVIQVTSDLGNGVSVAVGLENINNTNPDEAGVLAGVIAYAGDGISAHVTVAGGGVLDGTIENWGVHAGFTGTFDAFKVVAAVAADDTEYWNALASVSATFDMFTLALSGEAAADRDANDLSVITGDTDYGFGASAGFAVTDGVKINIGGRWYHDASDEAHAGDPENNFWQVAAQIVATVTESVTLTGEVGMYGNDLAITGNNGEVDQEDTFYGSAQVAWAPGGGFTSSLKGEVYSNGAYKATFKAAKTFE